MLEGSRTLKRRITGNVPGRAISKRKAIYRRSVPSAPVWMQLSCLLLYPSVDLGCQSKKKRSRSYFYPSAFLLFSAIQHWMFTVYMKIRFSSGSSDVSGKSHSTQQLAHERNSTFISSLAQIKFGLVWFYGISTIVGYLMPNSFLYIINSFISTNSV